MVGRIMALGDTHVLALEPVNVEPDTAMTLKMVWGILKSRGTFPAVARGSHDYRRVREMLMMEEGAQDVVSLEAGKGQK